jgi:hypothetical protein
LRRSEVEHRKAPPESGTISRLATAQLSGCTLYYSCMATSIDGVARPNRLRGVSFRPLQQDLEMQTSTPVYAGGSNAALGRPRLARRFRRYRSRTEAFLVPIRPGPFRTTPESTGAGAARDSSHSRQSAGPA